MSQRVSKLASRRAGLAATWLLVALPLCAQSPFDKLDHPLAKTDAVQYLYPEQVTVSAGKSTSVSLHFRIADGLHINSHKPKDELLLPTSLAIPAASGVKLDAAQYPDGHDYALPAEPGTKLSVYSGEFAIEAKITAQPGDHLVQAKLRYQACDQTQCMPPKTATVAIDVVGK